jgi:hypothetical protein
MYGRVPPRPPRCAWCVIMHKFKIVQHLFPARSVGWKVPDGAYVVVKRLPERDGEFEYQIKNVASHDERVVRESGPRDRRKSMRRREFIGLLICAWPHAVLAQTNGGLAQTKKQPVIMGH